MIFISIVSPVYKAENIISELIARIEKAVDPITEQYEIILVDDGSPDHSWKAIKEAALVNKKIKAIKLSRNFGQHHAISAGLNHASGEWVVVMDCDLQDQPEEIPKLLKKAQEGFEVVLARRIQRKDSWLKKIYSRIFYKTLGYLTGTKQDSSVANFGIYHKKVIHELRNMKERIRYFPAMVSWLGFTVTKLDVEHSHRYEGKTTYNFSKMMDLALSIILAYSDKPLKLTIKLGLLISAISFFFSFYTIIKWYYGGITVIGYASLITSIWFLSGCILVTLGITGLYVGKTFEDVKERPIYVVQELIND